MENLLHDLVAHNSTEPCEWLLFNTVRGARLLED